MDNKFPHLEYKSKLAPYIIGLIDEYRQSGYSFIQQAKDLKNFDTFLIENNFDTGRLDKDVIDAWSVKRETESLSSRNDRLSRVRILAKYMASLGIDVVFPPNGIILYKPVPYILTKQELNSMFLEADIYDKSANKNTVSGYGIILRLYYYCGLRLNEPLCLKVKDVALNTGELYIRHAKGNKDRRVFISGKLLEMVRAYDVKAATICPGRTFFFLGRATPYEKIPKTSVDAWFNKTWIRLYGKGGKHPTPHCIRHTFVVHRIDSWIENGEDVNSLMPVLKTHLGHTSTEETFYYYHSLDPQSKATRQCIVKSGDIARRITDEGIL